MLSFDFSKRIRYLSLQVYYWCDESYLELYLSALSIRCTRFSHLNTPVWPGKPVVAGVKVLRLPSSPIEFCMLLDLLFPTRGSSITVPVGSHSTTSVLLAVCLLIAQFCCNLFQLVEE